MAPTASPKRTARIREVQVPEVEHVDAQAADARLGRRPRAVGASVDPDLVVVGRRDAVRVLATRRDPPLGGDDDLVAMVADRAADERLVRATHAVRVRGIDHGDTEVERAVDGLEPLPLLDGAVEPDQHHRAVAGRRALELAQHPRRQLTHVFIGSPFVRPA
jgi:hypothetical protein